MELRRLPIHRSLLRPILFAGGERKLMMMNYTLIITLIFGARINSLTVLSSTLLFTAGHMCLIKLANYDPQFSLIYLRYRRYQDWYPAQSSITNKNHPVIPAIQRGARP